MNQSFKIQSTIYLYIMLILSLMELVPATYVLSAILLTLFAIVSSGTIFYVLLIYASVTKRYPFPDPYGKTTILDSLVYVLIPAHNEETVIERTARSVLNQNYKNFKLFLINDNSEDGTLKIMEKIQKLNPDRVVVINVPPEKGRKKPRALNYALEVIRKAFPEPEYVFVLDADYLLSPDTLARLVEIMDNAPNYIIGLQGNVRPRNWNKNFITKFITLERLVGFNVAIEGDMKLNDNGKCGGTVVLYRYSHLTKIGMFNKVTVTEDTELWARALISNYRFWYYHRIVGWEEAVETLGDYIKQRSRWAQGHLQVMTDFYWLVIKGCSSVTEVITRNFYLISYLVPVFWFLSVVLNGYLILTGQPVPELTRPKFFLMMSVLSFLVFWFSVAYSNWVEMKRTGFHVPWWFVILYPLYFMIFLIAGVIYTLRGFFRLLTGKLHWEKTRRFT